MLDLLQLGTVRFLGMFLVGPTPSMDAFMSSSSPGAVRLSREIP
jgi:hypothetical protein